MGSKNPSGRAAGRSNCRSLGSMGAGPRPAPLRGGALPRGGGPRPGAGGGPHDTATDTHRGTTLLRPSTYTLFGRGY